MEVGRNYKDKSYVEGLFDMELHLTIKKTQKRRGFNWRWILLSLEDEESKRPHTALRVQIIYLSCPVRIKFAQKWQAIRELGYNKSRLKK